MARTKVVPGSVANDDNLLILIAPKGGVAAIAAPTVTELDAGTVKDVTYSLTTDGWNVERSQASSTDERLTLGEVLEQPGRKSTTLEIKYVFGADDDVADPLLPEGFEGVAFARYAVPYVDDTAVADKFEAIPFKAGVQRVNPPTANGNWTKTQKLFVTGPVVDAVVVAGA